MKKTIALLVIVSLFFSAAFAQEKINIEVESETRANHFGLDEFYFVHQTFADAFFSTGLNKQLSHNEMKSILEAVLFGINDEEKVVITIDQKNSPAAKLVFFTLDHPEKGKALVMMTNYHKVKRTFTEQLDGQNSHVRWYYIKGKQLVYQQDLYSSTQESIRKANGPHELIAYYLFDGKTSNDAQVKPLIDELLASEDASANEKFYAKLHLTEYWLSKGEFSKAERAIADLKSYYKQANDLPTTHASVVSIAEAELEMVKSIKE